MSTITISADGSYPGEGRSRDLARGLLVYADGRNLTREGMGIGCPAAKTERHTLFSRTCSTLRTDRDHIHKIFRIDTGIGWGILGRLSPALTRMNNTTVDLYMRYPPLQHLLPLGAGFRTLFGIKPVRYDCEPPVEAHFEYVIQGSRIEISCRLQALRGGLPTIYLLNELGANAFRNGWLDGRPIPPPKGWEPIPSNPQAALYDPARRLCFRIGQVTVSEGMNARLYWGRERLMELCWAGYEIELDPGDPAIAEACCRYAISFDQEDSLE
jgi:hypothetical protein